MELTVDYMETLEKIKNGEYGEFIGKEIKLLEEDMIVLPSESVEWNKILVSKMNKSLEESNKKNKKKDKTGFRQFIMDAEEDIRFSSNFEVSSSQAEFIVKIARENPESKDYESLLTNICEISEFILKYESLSDL